MIGRAASISGNANDASRQVEQAIDALTSGLNQASRFYDVQNVKNRHSPTLFSATFGVGQMDGRYTYRSKLDTFVELLSGCEYLVQSPRSEPRKSIAISYTAIKEGLGRVVFDLSWRSTLRSLTAAQAVKLNVGLPWSHDEVAKLPPAILARNSAWVWQRHITTIECAVDSPIAVA